MMAKGFPKSTIATYKCFPMGSSYNALQLPVESASAMIEMHTVSTSVIGRSLRTRGTN